MQFWIDLSEILRNLGLTAAAGLGAWVAWERIPRERSQNTVAQAQATIARRDQMWELFNRATSQLGADKLEVRMGAIYTLDSIRSEFDELSQPVVEMLTSYIRGQEKDYGDDNPPADIREIMRIIRDESTHS